MYEETLRPLHQALKLLTLTHPPTETLEDIKHTKESDSEKIRVTMPVVKAVLGKKIQWQSPLLSFDSETAHVCSISLALL